MRLACRYWLSRKQKYAISARSGSLILSLCPPFGDSWIKPTKPLHHQKLSILPWMTNQVKETRVRDYPMPARKPGDPNAKSQSERLIEMARKLGCDEDEGAFP